MHANPHIPFDHLLGKGVKTFTRFPSNPFVIRVPFSYCSATIRRPKIKRAKGYSGVSSSIVPQIILIHVDMCPETFTPV